MSTNAICFAGGSLLGLEAVSGVRAALLSASQPTPRICRSLAEQSSGTGLGVRMPSTRLSYRVFLRRLEIVYHPNTALVVQQPALLDMNYPTSHYITRLGEQVQLVYRAQ